MIHFTLREVETSTQVLLSMATCYPVTCTSRGPAEVSRGFVKTILLVADCNPQAKSQTASLLTFPSLHPSWAGSGGSRVGCLNALHQPEQP